MVWMMFGDDCDTTIASPIKVHAPWIMIAARAFWCATAFKPLVLFLWLSAKLFDGFFHFPKLLIFFFCSRNHFCFALVSWRIWAIFSLGVIGGLVSTSTHRDRAFELLSGFPSKSNIWVLCFHPSCPWYTQYSRQPVSFSYNSKSLYPKKSIIPQLGHSSGKALFLMLWAQIGQLFFSFNSSKSLTKHRISPPNHPSQLKTIDTILFLV